MTVPLFWGFSSKAMDIQVASDSNKPIFCVECNDQEVRPVQTFTREDYDLIAYIGLCFL